MCIRVSSRRCPEGYSGNRCENERGVSVGIIVGCALAVFVLVVTVGYIYYSKSYFLSFLLFHKFMFVTRFVNYEVTVKDC